MATILPPSTPRGSTARHVRIGQRLSARRGPTEDQWPGSRRHQRARKYGLVTASVGPKLWTVRWDDGAETTERSTQLRAELPTAGEELASSPPPTPGDDHTNLRLVLAHPSNTCLLYTSDAADDSLRVDLGGRRIIKKIFFVSLP